MTRAKAVRASDTIKSQIGDAELFVAQTLARALAPRKSLTVSQWADQHYIVSRKGDSMSGRWRTADNPPLREPMDWMRVGDPTREVVLKFPIQFGKTMVAGIALGYTGRATSCERLLSPETN